MWQFARLMGQTPCNQPGDKRKVWQDLSCKTFLLTLIVNIQRILTLKRCFQCKGFCTISHLSYFVHTLAKNQSNYDDRYRIILSLQVEEFFISFSSPWSSLVLQSSMYVLLSSVLTPFVSSKLLFNNSHLLLHFLGLHPLTCVGLQLGWAGSIFGYWLSPHVWIWVFSSCSIHHYLVMLRIVIKIKSIIIGNKYKIIQAGTAMKQNIL